MSEESKPLERRRSFAGKLSLPCVTVEARLEGYDSTHAARPPRLLRIEITRGNWQPINLWADGASVHKVSFLMWEHQISDIVNWAKDVYAASVRAGKEIENASEEL